MHGRSAQPIAGEHAAGQVPHASAGLGLGLARPAVALITIFTALPDIDGNNPAAVLTWKMQHRSNVAAIMSWVQLGIPEVRSALYLQGFTAPPVPEHILAVGVGIHCCQIVTPWDTCIPLTPLSR